MERIDVSLGMPVKSLFERRANERQVGGNHYSKLKIQPWDAMEAWMSREEFAGFLRGNCLKYLARRKEGQQREDLRKAQHYLEKLIEVLSEDDAPIPQPPEKEVSYRVPDHFVAQYIINSRDRNPSWADSPEGRKWLRGLDEFTTANQENHKMARARYPE